MAEHPCPAPIPVDDEPAALYLATDRRQDPALVVVTVRGEIDLANIAPLRTLLASHADEPWLVVDMSAVRFCGVACGRLLHTLAVQSLMTGRRFEIVDNPTVARLLKAAGFASDITRRPSRARP